MNESEKIIKRYKEREKLSDVYSYLGRNYTYIFNSVYEREHLYAKMLITYGFKNCDSSKLLEVGAGSGANLLFFKRIGFQWKNITAVELIEERAQVIKNDFPLINLVHGDATLMSEDKKFDVIFQSTVFTSILDAEVKQQLAQKMLRLLAPGGIILWYDFIFDNPSNKDVKGIGRAEIKQLFSPHVKIEFKKVTLAPPVGRRVGRLYNIINTLFPFLRSHVIAVISR